jgi:hypothetical protein
MTLAAAMHDAMRPITAARNCYREILPARRIGGPAFRFGMADDRHIGVHRVQGHRLSIKVSPLTVELAGTDMLITSPPSCLPASSSEVRVLVELSKKQLMIVRPRNRLRFFCAYRFSST